MDSVYHNKRQYHLRMYHKDVYQDIMLSTSSFEFITFTERLYFYTNNMSCKPTCKKCNNTTIFRTNKYIDYCSNVCAMSDMPIKLGIANTSQLASVKAKKKKSSMEKYGVDNVSKSKEVKAKLSSQRSLYWENIYGDRDTHYKQRKEYNHICRLLTERQYKKYRDIIDPTNLRGHDWHLDHIYSISDGYLNNISSDIIAHHTNLRIISSTDNLKKSSKSHKTLNELCDLFKEQQ